MSIQSRSPPPPPPLAAGKGNGLLGAVTVSVAEAGVALLPAGPVTRALEETLTAYEPCVALITPKEMLHVPLAGIFAPESVTLPAVLVSDNPAPPHVLAGACPPKARFAGKDTVMPDWVSANALVLVKSTTSMVETFASTLLGENATSTTGGAGATVRG